MWSPRPSIAVSPLADFTPSPNTRKETLRVQKVSEKQSQNSLRSLETICFETPETVSRLFLGTGKRGHYERGLFAGEISRISKISKFSSISRKWSESPFFSTGWGFSRNSRISKFSRISRKWTFLKRPPFPKDPFFRTRVSDAFWTPGPEGPGKLFGVRSFAKVCDRGNLLQVPNPEKLKVAQKCTTKK